MSTLTAPKVDIDLEQLLVNLAPCDWRAGHAHTGTVCAEVATALMWETCHPEQRWRACVVAVAWVEVAKAEDMPCGHCGAPVRSCWRVVPI